LTEAMIISLGGTPEPIAHAIAGHRPPCVCFLASQQSVYLLGKVQELLEQKGFPLAETKVVLVDSVDDLIHCYERALECARFLEDRQIAPDAVMVDYTGGTKNMTAALALATVGKGYRFSYVGGSTRNKGGLGIVQTGCEVVHTGVSPWQIFAVQEWQHLVLYVSQYQYEAALTLVRETGRRLPAAEGKRWQGLETIMEGLLYWDRFNHKEALSKFKQGIEELDNWVQFRGDQVIADFIREGRPCLEFLQALAHESRGFQISTRLWLVDLVANAERRGVQGRYDDGMARLYRALELQGQIIFLQRTGASTSEAPLEVIPPALQDDFTRRYAGPARGKLQLPLFATFQVLQALGEPAADQFFARKTDFLKIINARNNSILAHGITPVNKKAFEHLRDLIRQTFLIEETVSFPRLRSPY
jgi:CRISPR-associated protein (TIGR02710 family)